MTQSNFNLPNTDGATFRSNNNTALQAHATWSSGNTAPSTTYPYQVWIDTANGLLKRRNASNTAWITEGRIDGSNPQTLKTAFRSPVATLSDLQAIGTGNLTTGAVRYMRGRTSDNDGGQRMFVWDGSDLSTEVSNDEVTANEGDGTRYVAPASDKTGASGAWVYAPTHRDFRISDFLPTNNPFADYTERLQLAVNEWLKSEHRNLYFDAPVSITDTILVDVDISGIGFNEPRILVGYGGAAMVNAKSDFVDSTKPAFKFYSSSGSTRINRMGSRGLNLLLTNNACGFLVEGYQYQCEFYDNLIKEPTDYGIKHDKAGSTEAAGGVRVHRNNIAKGSQAITAFGSRTGIGIDFRGSGGDAKITENLILYMKEGIAISDNSLQISDNHIFQGIEDDTQVDLVFDPCIHLQDRFNGTINGNYIDGGTILFEEDYQGTGTSGFAGYARIFDNKFITKQADTSAYQIGFKPKTSNVELTNLLIKDNQFEHFSGPNSTDVMQQPMAPVGGLGGSISSIAARNVQITDNYFQGDIVTQDAQPTLDVDISSGNVAVDLTGHGPFNLALCNRVRSIGVRTSSTTETPTVAFARTTNSTGTVAVSSAPTSGWATITFDVNTKDSFS